MKTILVTGGSGLLGANCLQILKKNNNIVGLYNTHKVSINGVYWQQLDLTNKTETTNFLTSIKPDIIIHCAALTDVDFCEIAPHKARQVNVEVSRMLATLAKKHDSYFVHISTDAVYGTACGGATENKGVVAVNEYANTKIMAEKVVGSANGEAIIIRTSIYGWNVQNKYSFAEAILKSLLNNQQTTLFQDVFFNPILVNNLIEIIIDLLAKGARGIYNVGSSDQTSKLNFGKTLAEIWGIGAVGIVPGNIAQKKLPAARPLNPTMNVEKVSKFLDKKMPTVRQGLEAFKILLNDGYVEQFKPGVFTLGQLKKVWS